VWDHHKTRPINKFYGKFPNIFEFVLFFSKILIAPRNREKHRCDVEKIFVINFEIIAGFLVAAIRLVYGIICGCFWFSVRRLYIDLSRISNKDDDNDDGRILPNIKELIILLSTHNLGSNLLYSVSTTSWNDGLRSVLLIDFNRVSGSWVETTLTCNIRKNLRGACELNFPTKENFAQIHCTIIDETETLLSSIASLHPTMKTSQAENFPILYKRSNPGMIQQLLGQGITVHESAG
jgi:hypothetical protein